MENKITCVMPNIFSVRDIFKKFDIIDFLIKSESHHIFWFYRLSKENKNIIKENLQASILLDGSLSFEGILKGDVLEIKQSQSREEEAELFGIFLVLSLNENEVYLKYFEDYEEAFYFKKLFLRPASTILDEIMKYKEN